MGGVFSHEKTPCRILIQGYSNAGKTTLLNSLKLGDIVTTVPTSGLNIETIESSGLEISSWNIGGRCYLRPLYRHYHSQTEGFIYMLDSTCDVDVELWGLYSIIRKDNFDTRDKVLMILANKQDLGNITVAEIESRFQKQLEECYSGLKLNLTAFVMPCCLTSNDNQPLWLVLNYFFKMIKSKKKGTLENGFIPSAWETAQQEAKTPNNVDVSVLHRLKTAVFKIKDPFPFLKSVLVY